MSNFYDSHENAEQSSLWISVMETLARRIKPHNYDMWLRPIQCAEIDGAQLCLKAPNRYIKEWFEDNYLPAVLEELSRRTQTSFDVRFELEEPEHVVEEPTACDTPSIEQSAVVETSTNGTKPCLSLSTRYTFDRFIAGPSNQLAYAAAQAVADLPAEKYNPLFIYGGVGLGKTHLLCAIGHQIKQKTPNAQLVYLSAEEFMNQYIHHLRSNRMNDFRSLYRTSCEVLLMDDIQFIAGKERTQDEFFHTFNALYELNRQIVVTSDKYPHEIADLEERLRTRFQWGLIADIQQPELETRLAIVQKKATMENISISDDVCRFLAASIRSNVRELEGALIRLAAVASIQHVPITIELAQHNLQGLVAHQTTNLSIETIQQTVSTHFGVKISELKGPRRHRSIAFPRQVAMYLCRQLTSHSFPEIGSAFGGKDHSTVISACRKISRIAEDDLALRATLETLQRQMGN